MQVQHFGCAAGHFSGRVRIYCEQIGSMFLLIQLIGILSVVLMCECGGEPVE